MNFQGKKIKIISILIIGILLSANFEAIGINAEVTSNYLKLTTNSSIDSIGQNGNRFLEKEMEKQKRLNPAIKQILSNKDIDIELRYFMATKISELEENDLSILFLMAFELSQIFEGQVRQFHNGFLIESERKWVILLEHGSDLTVSKECFNLIEDLAREYTFVVLASCDSSFLSNQYRNVDGFSGKVSFGFILEYLSTKLAHDRVRLTSVLSSQISYFKLEVTPAQFTDLSSMVQLGIQELIRMNFAEEIIVYFSGYILLEQGDDYWGATRINNKCINEEKPITNNLINEILSSSRSLYLLTYNFGQCIPPIPHYECTIYLDGPETASNYDYASVTIGISPNDQGSIFELSILSAELRDYPEPHIHGEIKKEDIYTYAVIHAPMPDLSITRLSAPSKIADGPLNLYRSGLNDYIQELADKSATDAVDDLLDGTIVGEVITWIDNQILTYCERGSVLYIVAWSTVIAAIIALLVLIIVSLIALFNWIAAAEVTAVLASKVPDIIAYLSYLLSLPAPTKSVPFPCYSSVILSLNSSSSIPPLTPNPDLFDDDNDGIPNAVEKIYYDGYIRGTPDENNYESGDDILWLDPNEDRDSDGLITMTEIIFNSNPCKADTDGDGLLDDQEIHVTGQNSTLQAYFTDYDRDGVLDAQNITRQGTTMELRSNPALCDSDYDGLGDYQEIDFNTEPFNSDTDGDRMIDGWEVYANMFGWPGHPNISLSLVNPLYEPDPPAEDWASLDLDGDGLNNTIESMLFTNPYDSDTDDDLLPDYAEIQESFSSDPTNNDTDFDRLSDGDEIYLGTDLLDADTDDDQMDDGWEVLYGLDPLNASDAQEDPDGDLLTNIEEYQYGTNPTFSDSDDDELDDYSEIFTYNTLPTNPDTDGDLLQDGSEIFYYFTDPLDLDTDGDALHDYNEVIVYHTDPNCIDTDNDTILDGVEVYIYGTNPNNTDSDNDGLEDNIELGLGTDPINPDSDGDSMPDGWEIQHSLNPLSSDSSGDLDGDGVDNYSEYYYNTNPNNSDTDGDGMPDGWEIQYGLDPTLDDAQGDLDSDALSNIQEYNYTSNPTNPDTDGDGMPDGWEVNKNFNPVYSADGCYDADGDGLRNFEEYNEGTNPHLSDTDSDGLDDHTEVIWGTNPLVADADADIDGDGLTNYEEINGVYDFNGDGDYDDPGEYTGYHTEPTQFDTDEDGYGDGYEIDPNLPYDPSDPTDPNSIPTVGGGLW